jgi:hypothetical protein
MSEQVETFIVFLILVVCVLFPVLMLIAIMRMKK